MEQHTRIMTLPAILFTTLLRAKDSNCVLACHFYSVLMDGSTNKGQVENELFMILFCKQDDTLQRYGPVPGIFVYWSQQELMQMGW